MFAAALWQQDRRRLVLARDRMGIKPLYYRQSSGDLHFGSELKAILEHPGIPRNIDRHGLDLYLAYNYIPSERTLIEGIRKLKPGHWLEWRDGDVTTEPYWTLPTTVDSRHTLEFGEGRARLAPAGRRAGAPAFRRPPWCLAEWRSGFDHHPALRSQGVELAPEDVLHFVSRAQLRRDQLHSAGRAGLRDRARQQLDLDPSRTCRERSKRLPTIQTSLVPMPAPCRGHGFSRSFARPRLR